MKRMEEALVRQNDEDIIYIGNIADQLYNSASGEFLRAIIQGKITEESRRYRTDTNTPSDRCLGRIEAYNNIIDAIEQAIADGKDLIKPKTEEEVDAERDREPGGTG